MKRKKIRRLFTALAGMVVAAVMCFTAVGCESPTRIWQPSEETNLNAYGATALDGNISFDYEQVSSVAYTVYVSPRGNNANDGRSLYSSVYSIKQAQTLLRNYLSSGGNGDCVIVLDDGEYFISNTLSIGYSDVPTDGKLYIRSKNPNGATISGAKRVDNSTVVETKDDEKLGRVWKIPCEKAINQLYVNEDYAIRARYPDAGEQLRLLNWDNSLKQIIIDEKDIKDFSDEEISGSSFVAEIMWAESYIRIENVLRDEKTANIVPVAQDIGVFARTSPNAKERQSYHLENSRAFLSARGEFWYSESERVVYYLPHESETLENTVIRIPYTEELLKIKSTADSPINGVHIEGINFMYSGNAHIDGKIGNQANKDDGQNKRFSGTIHDGRPYSAVTLEYVRNARMVGNKFACLGGGALDFTEGVENAEVAKNLFRSVGGNGILTGAIHYSVDMVGEDETTYVKDITVKDNYFHDIAWQEYGGVAVCFNYCRNGKITHNTVNNTRYSAICVGWGWSHDAYPFLENNEISYNRISCAINLMSDGSAIYLVGCQPYSEVFGNYIEYIYDSPWKYPNDLKEFRHAKWGLSAIYLDEGVGGTGEEDKVRVYDNYVFEGDADHFFTANAKTDENLRPLYEVTEIAEENKQAVKENAGADGRAFGEIYGRAKIFGCYTENESRAAVFGEALDGGKCALILKGKDGGFTKLAAADVISWTENKIVFNTANYSSGEAFILSESGTTSNRLFLSLNVNVQYEKYDRFIDEWGGLSGLARLLTRSKGLKNFEASSFLPGWSPSNIYDDNTFTGWSVDDGDTNPWITFKLDGLSTIRRFMIYARDGVDQAECRKNFEIHGYDQNGNDLLLFKAENAEAFPYGGVLVVNIEESEYADRIFRSFKICRPEGNSEYFFVAEVVVI